MIKSDRAPKKGSPNDISGTEQLHGTVDLQSACRLLLRLTGKDNRTQRHTFSEGHTLRDKATKVERSN